MSNEEQQKKLASLQHIISLVLGWPWVEIIAEGWKLARKIWRGMTEEGMYEVLEYETTLELKDKHGERAQFYKRQKVRYLQNNIIAYQDQAWGDGEILLDYRCSPGVEVDRYRPGHKTFILISLRETKQKGDTDEFHIEWGIQSGFVRSEEEWGTEISHSTKYLKVQLIFPKSRPPLQSWLVEYRSRRKFRLDQIAQRQLPDGRWLVQWETKKPRLHEQYILQWEW